MFETLLEQSTMVLNASLQLAAMDIAELASEGPVFLEIIDLELAIGGNPGKE